MTFPKINNYSILNTLPTNQPCLADYSDDEIEFGETGSTCYFLNEQGCLVWLTCQQLKNIDNPVSDPDGELDTILECCEECVARGGNFNNDPPITFGCNSMPCCPDDGGGPTPVPPVPPTPPTPPTPPSPPTPPTPPSPPTPPTPPTPPSPGGPPTPPTPPSPGGPPTPPTPPSPPTPPTPPTPPSPGGPPITPTPLPTFSPEPTISPIPPSCDTGSDVITILLSNLIEGHIYKVDFKINSLYYPINTYPESITFKANSPTKYISTIIRYSR